MLSSTTPCWLNLCTAGTRSTLSQTAGMNWVPGFIFFIIPICALNHSRDLRIQIRFLFWLQQNVLLWVGPSMTSGLMQIHPWPFERQIKICRKENRKKWSHDLLSRGKNNNMNGLLVAAWNLRFFYGFFFFLENDKKKICCRESGYFSSLYG